MRKILYTLLALLWLLALATTGCQNDPGWDRGRIEKSFYSIRFDECEYVVYSHVKFKEGGITHKGNCNNPIHKQK